VRSQNLLRQSADGHALEPQAVQAAPADASRPMGSLLGQLDAQHYLRERAQPKFGDSLYLHLSDLAMALDRHRTTEPVRVLDLGAGGSPYRYLFPNAVYQRADLPEVAGLDFHIAADGHVDAPSEAFDVVLSTQVLEHCVDPAVYLAEARRVLRPGGRLLLSTHGVFEDHGCPFDFFRWTRDGLTLELTAAGLRVDQCLKLTTGGRALAFLVAHRGYWMNGGRSTIFGVVIRAFQRILFARRDWFYAWCDATFRDNRVTASDAPEHSMYIALFVVATKSD
jgi:SAM-dependent methyltransferase